MLYQRRKWRNNLEGRRSTYMEQKHWIPPQDKKKVLFSNSYGWYLLISARYKYLTPVCSSSVENRKRNRLKSIYSEGKTCSHLICLGASECSRSFWVSKMNVHGETRVCQKSAGLCCQEVGDTEVCDLKTLCSNQVTLNLKEKKKKSLIGLYWQSQLPVLEGTRQTKPTKIRSMKVKLDGSSNWWRRSTSGKI